MNTRGSGSFLDHYGTVVGFIGGITIAGLGLTFRVLAFSNGVWFQGLGVGILRVQTSSWRASINY